MTEPSNKEPAPSRPNLKWIAIAVFGFVVIELTTNWPAVSSFAHVPEIKHMLGIG